MQKPSPRSKINYRDQKSPKILPKRQQNRYLNNLKRRIDEFIRYRKNNSGFLKKFYISLSTIFLILVFVTIFRINNFNKSFLSNIKVQENQCRSFQSKNPINSILVLDFNNSDELEFSTLYILNENKSVFFNLSNLDFNINYNNDKGKLSDYLKLNRIFFSSENIYENLNNFFLKELSVRIDHIFITRNYSFDEFVKDGASSYITKFDNSNNIKSKSEIQTNICKKGLKSFLKIYKERSLNLSENPWMQSKSITEYLNQNSVIKEQFRIHINNQTGADIYTDYFSNILKRYGINVVKADNDMNTSPKTEVYFNNNVSKEAETLDQIYYALGLNEKEINISEKQNIFADIYINLGTDLVK